MLTERYQFFVLSYDEQTGEIVTRANGDATVRFFPPYVLLNPIFMNVYPRRTPDNCTVWGACTNTHVCTYAYANTFAHACTTRCIRVHALGSTSARTHAHARTLHYTHKHTHTHTHTQTHAQNTFSGPRGAACGQWHHWARGPPVPADLPEHLQWSAQNHPYRRTGEARFKGLQY